MNSHYGRASAFSNRNAAHSTEFLCKTLRIMRQIIGVLVFALTVLIACEKPAYAYTDPGSAAPDLANRRFRHNRRSLLFQEIHNTFNWKRR